MTHAGMKLKNRQLEITHRALKIIGVRSVHETDAIKSNFRRQIKRGNTNLGKMAEVYSVLCVGMLLLKPRRERFTFQSRFFQARNASMLAVKELQREPVKGV